MKQIKEISKFAKQIVLCITKTDLQGHPSFDTVSSVDIIQRTLELLEWKLLDDFSKSLTNVVSKDT